MIWNAKKGEAALGDTRMSYASFGRGSKVLVLLPGLTDGLMSVRRRAYMLAGPYRDHFDRYTVCMFSRKDKMPDGYTIRQMADDQAKAMAMLGLEKACVLGISEGGMIAQYLAIDHPETVEKLILAVTVPCVNDVIRGSIGKYMDCAKKRRPQGPHDLHGGEQLFPGPLEKV